MKALNENHAKVEKCDAQALCLKPQLAAIRLVCNHAFSYGYGANL